VTAKAGLKGKGWSSDVAVFDYNDDGYLDLLVTNMFGMSQLYRNDKGSTFTDVTKEVLGHTSWGATGAKAFDFNNDGKLDLFLVDMHSDMWLQPFQPPRQAIRQGFDLKKKHPHVMGENYVHSPDGKGKEHEKTFRSAFKINDKDVLFGNTFFKNLGQGKFKEVSDKVNLETFWPWGAVPGDFDNDGFEDIFIPAGMGFPYQYWPSSLLMNNGNETFTDRAKAMGIEPPPGGEYYEEKIANMPSARSCRAAATLYRDGRLDLVVNNFNGRASYFRNHFPKKNYIAFRLTGIRDQQESGSNRDAVGALVYLYLGKQIMVRQVHPAGGYLSQSSQTLHFGLGEHTEVDRAEIRWPRGRRESIDNPEINKLHHRTEPKGK